MNTYIASHLRHLLTCLSTIGVLLASHKLIDPAAAGAVNAAGASLVDPLTVVGTACIVVGIRLAITFLGKIFPGLAERLTGIANGSSGEVNLLMLGTALALMGSLASCSTEQLAAAKSIPIHTKVVTSYGTATYDSKSGLGIEVDARSGK